MVKHGSIDKVYHAMFFLLKEKVPSILRPILKKCIRRAYLVQSEAPKAIYCCLNSFHNSVVVTGIPIVLID